MKSVSWIESLGCRGGVVTRHTIYEGQWELFVPYSWDVDHIQLEASGGSCSSYMDAPKEGAKGVWVSQCWLMLTNHGACGRSPSSEWTTCQL